jgi:hypothetical protein
MAYVSVPKDLNAVKTKVLLNRPNGSSSVSAGALIGVPLFFILKNHIATSGAALCMMIVMLPAFLLGMYEKNGQPLEKIIRNIVQVHSCAPSSDRIRTNNFYAVLERQDSLDKEYMSLSQQESSQEPEKGRLKKQSPAPRDKTKDSFPRRTCIPFQRMYPDGICR